MTTQLQLRKRLRSRRKQLTAIERDEKTNALLSKVLHHHRFRAAQRIAFYSAFDGEVDISPLLLHAYNNDKQCYLPVLPKNTNTRMRFHPFEMNDREQINEFGIFEPYCEKQYLISANKLDLILMPLVGFDESGHRLGMGGGFYDRCFSFRCNRKHWLKPYLLGVAFECQKSSSLTRQRWDVPMDACITEERCYMFNS